jgi:N-methylhydantoinase A
VLSWTITVSEPSLDVTLVKAPTVVTEIVLDDWREVLDGTSGAFQQCAIVRRSNLKNNTELSGPALIVEEQTTTYVPKSFRAAVNAVGYIILTASEQGEAQ